MLRDIVATFNRHPKKGTLPLAGPFRLEPFPSSRPKSVSLSFSSPSGIKGEKIMNCNPNGDVLVDRLPPVVTTHNKLIVVALDQGKPDRHPIGVSAGSRHDGGSAGQR